MTFGNVHEAKCGQAQTAPDILAAYGWPHDLTDDQILERLLALNLERADKEGR